MANQDFEFPVREALAPVPEEFPQPRPEAEYSLPDERGEHAPPPGSDDSLADESAEFSPPGSGRAEAPTPRRKKRLMRQILYGAAALVLLGLFFGKSGPSGSPASAPNAPVYTSSSDIPLPSLKPAPTPEPTPEAPGREPVIETDFFYFSHEHHARIRLSNTAALHSVRATVRETLLDKLVYEYYLTEEEIESGLFELPELSSGDIYMENMAAYDEVNGWPSFELTVDAWYENETGDGEDMLSITREADFEMGIGLSYMSPTYTWSESIPPDSFYVQPWEETDEINYVINDPDAVNDPLTFSVDISCSGRHASPDEYETVMVKSEYYIVDSESGERTFHTGYTKELVLRRPDWIPAEGRLHVCIVQYLASTGERWIREYDYEYPQTYDWEF